MINKSILMIRFEMSMRDEWQTSIKAREECAFKTVFVNTRRRRTEWGLKHRISQTESVIHLDELSTFRQVLEEVRERSRIDRDTRCIAEEISDVWRDLSVRIDPSQTRSLVCTGRRSLQELEDVKRGTTADPSEITKEHLQSLLEHPKGLQLFFQVAERLTRGQVVQEVQTGIRVARMTALRKTDGGSAENRGNVVRRLAARKMSQQLMDAVQQATTPFQCVMTSKAGRECISYVLQALNSQSWVDDMSPLGGWFWNSSRHRSRVGRRVRRCINVLVVLSRSTRDGAEVAFAHYLYFGWVCGVRSESDKLLMGPDGLAFCQWCIRAQSDDSHTGDAALGDPWDTFPLVSVGDKARVDSFRIWITVVGVRPVRRDSEDLESGTVRKESNIRPCRWLTNGSE